MANRSQPAIDASANPLQRPIIESIHPPLRPTSSFPVPAAPRGRGAGGMSSRRPRPGFTLRDIDSTILPSGGGASGAGLGAGRPSLPDPPRRPVNMGTPFANFSRIVYAPINVLQSHCFSNLGLKGSLWRSQLCGQGGRSRQRSRFLQRLFLFYQHDTIAA
jgi:hypothetical protein